MASTQSTDAIRSIVIAGGGAAGWLSAAIIASEHNLANNPHLSITVVESPNVNILGVGEGTWPTMRDTLRRIGIDETTFLLSCDASFKQGTRFINWCTPQVNQATDVYDHPFGLPAGFFDGDIVPWWLEHQNNTIERGRFSQLFSTQTALCDASKAPKQLQTPPYAGVANYGYHLNAYKFAELLKSHCIKNLGVEYIRQHIDAVVSDTENDIVALKGKGSDNKERCIKGDFFIDCTGFSTRLIGEHYCQPLCSVSHTLKNDTALALQVPYTSENVDIASSTLSTAHANGWIWDIGLPQRKGVGCVYSSDYCSDDTAADALLSYLRNDEKTSLADEGAIRKISFTPGYRKKTWINNCVALGTAAGFVEPLEASALVMIELSAKHIAEHLPTNKSLFRVAAKHFNTLVNNRWQRIVDFLKLHYVLSLRNDSDYWRAMSDLSSASENLQDWLAQWQHRPISISDFIYAEELFPAASYMYVMYGMQPPKPSMFNKTRYSPARMQAAQNAVQQNRQRTQQQLAALPTNRSYFDALKQRAEI